ncbi:hypothetical protein EIN_249300 [Entamoeba invadens IP1]|uniref:Protein kinase domain-containing protein n=1 Tax=Entamoeba invadens IP1 TaxID=370355 RepID=A0A0A1UE68_ENTIV|nr:hypothetical protein EIN_249300 [Entamoeba invadens IP1]ELP94896.1 hypothetical protein EIN_249300 [Entamoeba invadens IP1]|eukprot:XP_004261667.1 hypothetical protein EIN_249300 [Entamoeba invadens IP1]
MSTEDKKLTIDPTNVSFHRQETKTSETPTNPSEGQEETGDEVECPVDTTLEKEVTFKAKEDIRVILNSFIKRPNYWISSDETVIEIKGGESKAVNFYGRVLNSSLELTVEVPIVVFYKDKGTWVLENNQYSLTISILPQLGGFVENGECSKNRKIYLGLYNEIFTGKYRSLDVAISSVKSLETLKRDLENQIKADPKSADEKTKATLETYRKNIESGMNYDPNSVKTMSEEFLMVKNLQQKLISPYILNFIGMVNTPISALTEMAPFGDVEHFYRDFRLTDTLKYKIFQDVSMGLAACHKVGILHLDMKPSNIFVFSTNPFDSVVAKIADFGTAKRSNLLNALGLNLVSTPLYSPPECSLMSTLYSKDFLLSRYFADCGYEEDQVKAIVDLRSEETTKDDDTTEVKKSESDIEQDRAKAERLKQSILYEKMHIGEKIDIYCFGLTCFEICAERPLTSTEEIRIAPSSAQMGKDVFLEAVNAYNFDKKCTFADNFISFKKLPKIGVTTLLKKLTNPTDDTLWKELSSLKVSYDGKQNESPLYMEKNDFEKAKKIEEKVKSTLTTLNNYLGAMISPIKEVVSGEVELLLTSSKLTIGKYAGIVYDKLKKLERFVDVFDCHDVAKLDAGTEGFEYVNKTFSKLKDIPKDVVASTETKLREILSVFAKEDIDNIIQHFMYVVRCKTSMFYKTILADFVKQLNLRKLIGFPFTMKSLGAPEWFIQMVKNMVDSNPARRPTALMLAGEFKKYTAEVFLEYQLRESRFKSIIAEFEKKEKEVENLQKSGNLEDLIKVKESKLAIEKEKLRLLLPMRCDEFENQKRCYVYDQNITQKYGVRVEKLLVRRSKEEVSDFKKDNFLLGMKFSIARFDSVMRYDPKHPAKNLGRVKAVMDVMFTKKDNPIPEGYEGVAKQYVEDFIAKRDEETFAKQKAREEKTTKKTTMKK